jgi:histone H3
LEAEVGLEVLGDFTNKSLERQLSDQELSGLLVATDLTESDSSWLISVGLLDTSGGWCRLAGSFL